MKYWQTAGWTTFYLHWDIKYQSLFRCDKLMSFSCAMLQNLYKDYRLLFPSNFKIGDVRLCFTFFSSSSSSGSSSWSSRGGVWTGPWRVRTHHTGHVTSLSSTCTTWASTCSVYEPTWTGVTPTGCRGNLGPIKTVREREGWRWEEGGQTFRQDTYRKDVLYAGWGQRVISGGAPQNIEKQERAAEQQRATTTKWCRWSWERTPLCVCWSASLNYQNHRSKHLQRDWTRFHQDNQADGAVEKQNSF